MTYMQSNLAFAGGIQELSLNEIGFVMGGNNSRPAPTCPKGTRLQSATYDGNGKLKEYKCVATDTSSSIEEGASMIDKVASALDKLGGLIGL